MHSGDGIHSFLRKQKLLFRDYLVDQHDRGCTWRSLIFIQLTWRCPTLVKEVRILLTIVLIPHSWQLCMLLPVSSQSKNNTFTNTFTFSHGLVFVSSAKYSNSIKISFNLTILRLYYAQRNMF